MKVILSLDHGITSEARVAIERELARSGFVPDPTKERLARLGTLVGELGDDEIPRLVARVERGEIPGLHAVEPDQRRRAV